MFGKFGKKRTSFHNVQIDSGSYLDVDISTTNSLNHSLLNDTGNPMVEHVHLHGDRNTKDTSYSNSSLFASPFLETTWTTSNALPFITYMIFQTFLPFYWFIAGQTYDYPLTLLCLQLLVSITLLFTYTAITYHCCFQYHATSPKRRTRILSTQHVKSNDTDPSSGWANLFKSDTLDSISISSRRRRAIFVRYFCSKFWFKCRLIVFPSTFFILTIVIDTVAISYGSTHDIHILWRATEMLWLVLLSPFLLTDYPSKISIICAITVTFGALCFSWKDAIIDKGVSSGTVLCYVLSSVFKPFEILFLRRSTRILTQEESETRKMEGIELMSKAEMTLLYLICAVVILLPFAFIFEGRVSWTYLDKQFGSHCNCSMIIIGGVLLLFYEWNLVLLMSNIEPLIVGIGQQSQALWRYVAAMFLGGVTLNICDCVGSGNECSLDTKYPACPCWRQPKDLFDGKYLILHWFGLLFITLGLVFYCYLKAKNKHVTNVNIFAFNRCR